MYERRNYLKKAYYHLMKIEMKKNKKAGYEGYQKDNAELSRIYSQGDAFESGVVVLCQDLVQIKMMVFMP